MTAPRSNVFTLEPNLQILLRDLGAQPRSVLRRADLPEDLFSRGEVTLSTAEYFRFWNALEDEIDDPTFPLRLAQAVRTEAFHPLIFAALCSSDFAIAASRIAHYKRLCAPMDLIVHEEDHSFSLEFQWLDRSVVPPSSLAAFELIFFVQLIRMATREDIHPLRVESAVNIAPDKETTKNYTDYFGVTVEHSDAHRITFSTGDAHRPFLTANETMWTSFEPDLRRRLSDLDESATFRDRVSASLLEALPAGESSMDQVARKLAVSKRTLQRKLKDEGTSFQVILDETRLKLANHYLRRSKLSGAEISYLLGYQDPNSFFRAFHTWTGTTTEQVRLTETRGMQ